MGLTFGVDTTEAHGHCMRARRELVTAADCLDPTKAHAELEGAKKAAAAARRELDALDAELAELERLSAPIAPLPSSASVRPPAPSRPLSGPFTPDEIAQIGAESRAAAQQAKASFERMRERGHVK